MAAASTRKDGAGCELDLILGCACCWLKDGEPSSVRPERRLTVNRQGCGNEGDTAPQNHKSENEVAPQRMLFSWA